MVPFTKEEENVSCKLSGITQPKCTYYPSGLLSNG